MKKFSFLVVLLILLLGGFAAWWINGNQPANPAIVKEQTFTVNQGEGVRQVANNLKSEGLIKDPIIFFLLVKQQNADNKIQAGEFRLAPAMDAKEILTRLQTALQNDTIITIPEGKRAGEIADILETNFPNYTPDWETELEAYEGYLFPDTYAFEEDAEIADIITTMREHFDTKYASIPQGPRNATQDEIVKIASLVEREARFAEDRPLVASVIFNRLDIDMALNIDATVQYAIGSDDEWWPQLNDYAKDIAPNSIYNTYTHAGLPPTPISNPGLDVLTAVINAPDTDYLYYITDPETGKNVYARTLEEHNINIENYGL